MTKFILKTYIKELYSKDNNLTNLTIKEIAKYNLRKNDKLYNFDIYLDGEYYDNINVYLTKDRNRALNRYRGFDLNYSANNICLYQNECTYYVYNEMPKYWNYGAFKN